MPGMNVAQPVRNTCEVQRSAPMHVSGQIGTVWGPFVVRMGAQSQSVNGQPMRRGMRRSLWIGEV